MRIKGIIENIRNDDRQSRQSVIFRCLPIRPKVPSLRRKCEKAESHGKGHEYFENPNLFRSAFSELSSGFWRDDLLLCRNLLVFCPYILMLKKNRNAVVFILFFHLVRIEKRKTRRKAKVEVGDILSRTQTIREPGKGEIQ